MLRFAVAILVCLAASAGAQTGQPRLPILRDVGIDQLLNAQVPADLPFRDETGRDVRLGDYFGKRPMILALVYYKCPGLCTMVLNDITRAMNSMRATCGEQFDIVTVSFDPHETPDLAFEKKQQYLRAYQRASAKTGWHFLTGDAPAIAALTGAVGFRYAWDEKYKQYAHASGIIVLTPQGKTSRYLYGIDYAPTDLELAIAEAGQGKSVSITDKVLLYCFHYDPATGKYSLMITRVVQAGGVITVLVVVGMVLLLSRAGPKKPRPAAFPLSGRPHERRGGQT
jgi:protein SCO1/2